jgi:hypothetical protein
MYEAIVNRGRRLITFKASGNLTLQELQQCYEEGKWATDAFKGEQHIVLADMRGLVPLSEDKLKIFGDIIRYGRERGCIACVHLSDSSIARLQHSRIAREAAPHDTATINVVSIEEGDRVINELIAKILAAPKKK